MKQSILITKKENFLIADIVGVDDWEGFEAIAKYLQKFYPAKVVDRLDGPDSRVWKFDIDGKIIFLHNNPYGNYFKILDDVGGQILLRNLANDLNKRLDN